MSQKNTIVKRMDKDFDEWIKEITRDRLKLNMDKDQVRTTRIQKAIIRVPKLKEILIKAKLK